MSKTEIQVKVSVIIESDLPREEAVVQFIENTDYTFPSTEDVHVIETELFDYDIL